MACPFEISALRPAGSVRPHEVRLAVGSRHGELGGADVDGLITLERARRQGLIRGSEFKKRLRLGAEMLLDRACPEGGWNAGNAVVYGVPLRPHIDATALALAALRFHYHLPIVRSSLTWILNRIDCPSAYSLAWVILAAAAYRDVRSDVLPALDIARDRLAALVDDPRAVQDTSTIALAALALGPGNRDQPFRGKGVSTSMNRRIFGGGLLAGTGALAVRRLLFDRFVLGPPQAAIAGRDSP